MSYDDLIVSAKSVVENHNKNVDKENEVDFDSFLKKLRNAGGTSEATLNKCSWEMLEKFGLPSLIAVQVSDIFRKKNTDSVNPSSGSAYISERKVQQLTTSELIERFDLNDPDSVVGKRLYTISKGRKFIVLNTDGTIDIAVSDKLLKELKLDSERELFVENGGSPRQVYSVGDRPNAYANKNPLYSSRLLRPDESCDQTNRSWANIPLEIRQWVYIATRQTGEIKINSLADAHNVLDLVTSPDAVAKLQARLPKAVLMLKALNDTNSAPTLKTPLAKKSALKVNDPFHGHKNY